MNFNTPTVKQVVENNNLCYFSHLRQGYAYYTVRVWAEEESFIFPVELSDLGEATLKHTEKAILLMRYIRKALSNDTFVKHQTL